MPTSVVNYFFVYLTQLQTAVYDTEGRVENFKQLERTHEFDLFV